MNKVILLLFFSFFSLQMFSQDTTTRMLTKEDYLKKSRSQKIGAWVLIAGGVGLIALAGETFELNLNPSSRSGFRAHTVLAVASLGAFVGSIPLFISSAQNKKKAASLSFNNRQLFLPYGSTWVNRTQPTLSLKIPFQ